MKRLGHLAQGTRRLVPGYLAVILVAGSLAGCGLFELRDPVEPIRPPDIPRRQPIDPDSVLFNFSQAVMFKLDGMSQYEEALAETYGLVMDQVDVIELGLGVDSLSQDQDIFAQRIFVQETSDSLFFQFGDVAPERTGNTAFYDAIPYELQFLRAQADTFVVVEEMTVRGTADLTIQEGEQIWAMTRWVDERDPGGAESWGRIHGSRAVISSGRPPSVVN